MTQAAFPSVRGERVGRGLVVEVAGLPGAGKSRLADDLKAALEGGGIAVTDVTAGIAPTSSRVERLTRKVVMLARALAGGRSVPALARAASGTRQPTAHDRLARPVNVVLSAALTDQAKRRDGVSIMDQGITQDSWSLALRADRTRALASVERLLRLATLPDVIVFVEAPLATLAERLRVLESAQPPPTPVGRRVEHGAGVRRRALRRAPQLSSTSTRRQAAHRCTCRRYAVDRSRTRRCTRSFRAREGRGIIVT